jgi:hypothetical protein
VRPVGIVVSHEENLLPFLEDEISHLHNVCVRFVTVGGDTVVVGV